MAGRDGSGLRSGRNAAAEGIVAGRQLGRGEGLQHVELVAVGVGHDHPADLALADADLAGAERFEAGDFGGLAGGAQVEVEPVLHGLVFGNSEEQQVGSDAVLRAALGRFEADLVVVFEGAAPAQGGFPEGGDPGRVGGVDAQALDAYGHELIVSRSGGQRPPILRSACEANQRDRACGRAEFRCECAVPALGTVSA